MRSTAKHWIYNQINKCILNSRALCKLSLSLKHAMSTFGGCLNLWFCSMHASRHVSTLEAWNWSMEVGKMLTQSSSMSYKSRPMICLHVHVHSDHRVTKSLPSTLPDQFETSEEPTCWLADLPTCIHIPNPCLTSLDLWSANMLICRPNSQQKHP